MSKKTLTLKTLILNSILKAQSLVYTGYTPPTLYTVNYSKYFSENLKIFFFRVSDRNAAKPKIEHITDGSLKRQLLDSNV